MLGNGSLLCLIIFCVFNYSLTSWKWLKTLKHNNFRHVGTALHYSISESLFEDNHIMTCTLPQLTNIMGGSGKAKAIWECLKSGKDPLLGNELTEKGKRILSEALKDQPMLSSSIAAESLATCGTRKMLLKLSDGLEIESVLIPSSKFMRTTLCVSTQVGCDRGCVFCLTGKMGLIRNLTAIEILDQVVYGLNMVNRYEMPPLLNIVFMGMGDAGRNFLNVGRAVECLVDPLRFSFAQSKVTISTVGPSPEIFEELAKMPASIAWSLHSSNDTLRKMLVPTTRHSTVELRESLLSSLSKHRTVKKRTLMLACTLVDEINDKEDDALALAEFVKPMLEIAPKIAIDLIPYNDINYRNFRRPSKEKVNAFQQILRKQGLFCSVRITRGDDEFAACGMLATKKRPSKLNKVKPSNISM